MTPDEFERLQAAEMHEVTVIEPDNILIEGDKCCGQIMSHYYTGKPALSVLTSVHAMDIRRVDELIALLQKARELMGGA